MDKILADAQRRIRGLPFRSFWMDATGYLGIAPDVALEIWRAAHNAAQPTPLPGEPPGEPVATLRQDTGGEEG